MEKILVDSCIFIDIFRGDQQLYHALSEYEAAINSIVYMELVQGARNKTELKKIDTFLNRFEIISVDEEISLKSMELMKSYSLSHGLLVPDAMIAATALVKDLPLWTFNLKDFRFIQKLNLVRH
jgi:predicted nucleic acid-binding protein